MNYKYILRYYIHPGYQESERIIELVNFCQTSKVDEVMLFFNAEETFIGHITVEQLRPWLGLAKKIKNELNKIGVELSVNPWITVAHCPRGRKLYDDQDFTLMVGEDGRTNGVTVCPSCSKWLDYITELWSVVAKELTPGAIWLEDDFRLHNHEIEGCFCANHLQLFSRIIGRESVSREEVVGKVFSTGTPHPWRKKWLELNNRIFNNAAKKIHDAVRKASSTTRTALMCSSVDIASAEGRNWHDLQNALGFEPAFMVRPNMGGYTEMWPMLKVPVNCRLTAAALKRPIELLPEFESGPRHGAYSKGCDYAAWELMGSVCFGAGGITMNHYDMIGCGIETDRKFGSMLTQIKPQLTAISQLGIDDNNSSGINILFSTEIAKYFHAKSSGKLSCLYNNTTDWGKTMTILGISYRFTDKVVKKAPYLIGGQTLRAFSDNDIKKLLANPVLLDGEAAAILVERGFGKLIGLKSAELISISDYGFSWENIPEENGKIYGLKNPCMTTQRATSILYKLVPVDDCEILSNIIKYDGSELFPGTIVFYNKLGGTIATIAYGVGDANEKEYFYMGFFNKFRRIFMQRLLRKIAPQSKFAMAENDPFQVYRCSIETGEFAAMLNSSTDASDGLTLRLCNCTAEKVLSLDKNGIWESDVDLKAIQNGRDLILTHPGEIRAHKGRFFKIFRN